MTGSQHGEIARIQSVVARVAHDIDGKDWLRLRGLYADDVDTDYSSLFGGMPLSQRGDDLIEGWRKVLAGVSTQHLLGPIDVTLSGSVAAAECHVRAWHHASGCAGGDEWVVGGHYVFALAQTGEIWRITGMTLKVFHQTGNAKLLPEANRELAAHPREG